MQAWWGGRWMNSRRDGAANDIHRWPHPPKVGTKLTLGPFHSPTLTIDLNKRIDLCTAGVTCRPPPPFARVGEGLSRNTPMGAQLALKFRGALTLASFIGDVHVSVILLLGQTGRVFDPRCVRNGFHKCRRPKCPRTSTLICRVGLSPPIQV